VPVPASAPAPWLSPVSFALCPGVEDPQPQDTQALHRRDAAATQLSRCNAGSGKAEPGAEAEAGVQGRMPAGVQSLESKTRGMK